MENALEITIISVLGGIVAALIAVGGVGFFWLVSKIDRLTEHNNTSHNELSEKIDQSHDELVAKIDQSHNELSEKIDRAIAELREDFARQLERVKAEIVSALVNHTHPESGGPPAFTAPPPVVPPDSLPAEPEPAAAPADN